MMIDPDTKDRGGSRRINCTCCLSSGILEDGETLPVGWTTITSRLANPRNPADVRYLADYFCGTECFNLCVDEMADGTPLPDDHYDPMIWEANYYERN